MTGRDLENLNGTLEAQHRRLVLARQSKLDSVREVEFPPSPSRGGVWGGGIQKDELRAGSTESKTLVQAKTLGSRQAVHPTPAPSPSRGGGSLHIESTGRRSR